MRRTPLTVGLVGLTLTAVCALTACSTPQDPVTEVRAGSIRTLADLGAPTDEDVVLTLTWDGADPVRLTLDQIEAMRTVSVEIHEPFLDRTVEFEGVALGELLELTGMPDEVTVLHTVALNEYAVDIPVPAATDPAAILATRADGERIPVDAGGPTRVVLTDDHPDVRDESLWIWSIATVAAPGGSGTTS